MPSEQPVYRKFSKQRKSLFNIAQLWAASDHLLLVNSVFAVESYRRFYFHEIEALIVRRTATYRTWIIINCLGVAIMVALVGVLYRVYKSGQPALGGVLDTDVALGFAALFGVLGLLFFIGLLWQLILGPTCVIHLQMRNGLEKLDHYDRLRPALQMRDRLRQLLQPPPA